MGIDSVRKVLKSSVFHEDCLIECVGEGDVKLLSGWIVYVHTVRRLYWKTE